MGRRDKYKKGDFVSCGIFGKFKSIIESCDKDLTGQFMYDLLVPFEGKYRMQYNVEEEFLFTTRKVIVEKRIPELQQTIHA